MKDYQKLSECQNNTCYICITLKTAEMQYTLKEIRRDLEKIYFNIYMSNTFSGMCLYVLCLYGELAVYSHFSESLFIKYTSRNNPKDTGNLQKSFRIS